MNLFELTGEYLNLLELAEDPDTDPEVLADTMEGISGEIEDKADSYAYVINTINGDIDVVDAEIKRLQARKKTLSNNAESIKKNLYAAMITLDMRKLKTAKHTFSIAKNGGKIPVVINEGVSAKEIPEAYRTVKYDFNKDAIREALEKGAFIPFAELGERGESLRIK